VLVPEPAQGIVSKSALPLVTIAAMVAAQE
jgi:hypothetical protein